MYDLDRRRDLDLVAGFYTWINELNAGTPRYPIEIDTSSATIWLSDTIAIMFTDDRITYVTYSKEHRPMLKSYEPSDYEDLDDLYRTIYSR